MFQVMSGSGLRAARLLAVHSTVVKYSVRGRKSRTDPIAKSKEGRTKVPPPVDLVEMVVLKWRFSEYQMIMRALRMQFKKEVLQYKYEEERGFRAEKRVKQEAAEHQVLMAWNDEENLRRLSNRLLRIQKEEEEVEQRKAEAAIQREEEQQEFILEKEEEILKLQEEAKTFISMENLDERIELALGNEKNYNFAIDKEGRVVKQTMLQ